MTDENITEVEEQVDDETISAGKNEVKDAAENVVKLNEKELKKLEKEAKKKEKKEKKEKKDSKKTKEVLKLEKELDELLPFKDKFYYLAAEMENIKKRNQRDRENLIKYGNQKVLSDLIEVVDNLERTQNAIKDDEDEKIKNIFNGIEMVHSQFLSKLKDNGLEQIECLGKVFDPNFHEAMAQQPAEGKEDQEIIEEYQKGYVLNGRLLRAAKVIVVKN
jgi:molecular chaperone GrpE